MQYNSVVVSKYSGYLKIATTTKTYVDNSRFSQIVKLVKILISKMTMELIVETSRFREPEIFEKSNIE